MQYIMYHICIKIVFL